MLSTEAPSPPVMWADYIIMTIDYRFHNCVNPEWEAGVSTVQGYVAEDGGDSEQVVYCLLKRDTYIR